MNRRSVVHLVLCAVLGFCLLTTVLTVFTMLRRQLVPPNLLPHLKNGSQKQQRHPPTNNVPTHVTITSTSARPASLPQLNIFGAAKTTGTEHAMYASAMGYPEVVLTRLCAEATKIPPLSCKGTGYIAGIQAWFGVLEGGCDSVVGNHASNNVSHVCVNDTSMFYLERCMGKTDCSKGKVPEGLWGPSKTCPPHKALRNVVTIECLSKPEIAKTTQKPADYTTAATPEARLTQKLNKLQKLRVLIFITTHLSNNHKQYLKRCWPSLPNNSALVRHADVMLFINSKITHLESMLHEAFPGKNVTVKSTNSNLGYQKGAMLPVERGLSEHWFSGYDWVIRVNPDVIILEDDWLIETMLDQKAGGIFADCKDRCRTPFCTTSSTNSDFFAFRLTDMPSNAFSRWSNASSAETQAKLAFFHIAASGRDRWVGGTSQTGTCRVRGRSVPVLHSHILLSQCPLKPGEPKSRNIS